MPATRDILKGLQEAQPTEPRGWFRWLYNHFLGRYPFSDDRFEATLAEQGWQEISEAFPDFAPEEAAAFAPVVAKHAWTVGYLGLTELADACWERLKAEQRGAILAGLTEMYARAELVEWIRARLPFCAFSPESACQIACNAIWHKWPDILTVVLASGVDLASAIHRGDEGDYPETRWPDIVAKLSHRIIDMVLEAALVRNDSNAVRMALDNGANPNLAVWRLERSYNEKHCALSFAISEDRKHVADLLLQAGATAAGIDFTPPEYPLYLAISKGWDDLAERLLQSGASLRAPGAPAHGSSAPKTEGSESEVLLPFRGKFFGHFDKELNWARTAIGSVIPLAPITEKQAFYQGNGQGGQWTTILNAVIGNVGRLQRYEALGLDTRLTDEELCSAVDRDAFDGLLYLLGKHGTEARDRIIFRMRRRKPELGSVSRQLDVQPQSDLINNADGFDPENQPPLVLPDGAKLYVDLSAIAPAHHTHGPCLEGHFWLRVEEATWRRRQDRVVMTELRSRWAMTKLPANRHQVKSLLPCIKDVGGVRTRLGVTIGNLFFRVSPEDERKNAIYAWFDTPEFQSVIAEATARIRAQDHSNSRPRTPALSESELTGYPEEFWPYLVRLESGFIGVTLQSCSDRAAMTERYAAWTRQNKCEDSFVPDPRLLSWVGWKDVPQEFQPFFEIDQVLETPTVRFRADNDYEQAMIHKAVQWKNAWMTPRILAEIEKHRRDAASDKE